EIAKHLFGYVEVGDNAVLHRPNGDHAFWRASEHPLGLEADSLDLLRRAVDGDHGRLIENDPLALHVNEGVGGSEVHANRVRGEETSRLEEGPAHQSRVRALAPVCRERAVRVTWAKTPKASVRLNERQAVVFSRPTPFLGLLRPCFARQVR